MTGRSRRNTAAPTTPSPAEAAPATPAPEAAAPEAAAPAGLGAGSAPNRATAAFEEYRNRMDAAAGRFPGGRGVWAGQPVPLPYPYGGPDGDYPPPGRATPPAAAPPFAAPGYGAMSGWGYPPDPVHPWGMRGGSRQSFMESVGTLVRLGIEAANAVLAGTLQAVEGGMGREAFGSAMPWPGDPWARSYNPYSGPCECCEHCCGPCPSGCCCNPGVRNCF